MPQRLAQHLIARGLLPAGVIDQALKRLARDGGGLDSALLEMGAISEAGMLQAVSDASGVRLVNLADFEPNAEASPLVPFKMARQLMLVPLSLDGAALHVACAYPIPATQLKDVGFLLGRKLELWVALEARVRDWQAVVYGQPLEPRYARLLATLDPSRKKPQSDPPQARPSSPSGVSKIARPLGLEGGGMETESLSSEVLDRIAQGIVDEPVLLSAPKKKARPTLEVVSVADTEEPNTTLLEPRAYSQYAKHAQPIDDPKTAEVDTTAYARFAKPDAEPVPMPLDEEESTRVLEAPGYANFAREMSKPLPYPGERVSFPGGVLPPRKDSEAPKPQRKMEPSTWVHPASPVRPAAERVRASSPSGLQGSPSGVKSSPSGVQAALPSGVRPSSPSGVTAPPVAPQAKAPEKVAKPPPAPPAPKAERSAPPVPEAEAAPTPPSGTAETDFSEVNEVLFAPKPPPVVVPPEPPPAKLAPPARLAPPSKPHEGEITQPPEPAPPRPGQRADSGVIPAPRLSPGRRLEAITESSDGPTEGWQVTRPASAAPEPPPPPSAPGLAAVAREPALPPGVGVGDASAGILASPPGLAPASAAEWTLAQARASLKQASQDREQLVNVILEYGRRAFEYVGAFAVMRGAAYGWDARGDGDLAAIRQISIPLDAASVFRTVALTRGSYVGPLPPDALTQHYLALLGRGPRTVFIWPVEVQSRLVAMLYGDCGGRPVSQRRLSDFILFCQDLPSAFHDLIVFRKQNPRNDQTLTPVPQAMPEALTAAPTPTEAPADAEWFSGLIQLLTGPDPSERSMAMLELMKTPDASAVALAKAFPGPTGWSRLPVVDLPEPDELGPIPGALARLGPSGAFALAPLLDSSDSDTRYLALLTAGSLRYPEVIAGTLRGLFDLEPDISSAARAAASSIKYLPQFQAKLPQLRQELATSDPLRRSLAARALGVLHDRDAIDGLINLTGSEDELCAQSAAEALKEVTRAAFGANPRAWTAWYAGARTRRRIEWLVEALASPDFDLRLSAIEELSRTFGDNFGFFADGPAEERSVALASWAQVVAARPDLDV